LPYAWRVFRRRRELLAVVVAQERVHGEVRRALREQLAGVVAQATSGAADGEAVTPLLKPVAEAEAQIEASSQQLDATAGQFAERLEAVERKLAEAHAARTQAQRDRDLAQIHLEDCQQKQARARAALRRADEMLQAAHDAAAAAAGRGAEYAPPEHARRIAQREADRLPLADRLRNRARAAAEAVALLKQRERGVKAADRRISAVLDARAALEAEATSAKDSSFARLDAARVRRLDAYELVLAQIEADHPALLNDELRRRVATVRGKLAEADADLERHRRAVDAYDRDGYRRGVLVAAAIGLLLLLLLLTTVRVGAA